MADQAMPIENGVNGAAGGDFDRVRQSPQQALADFASSPSWFLAPGCDDRRLDLFRELVGVAKGPASAVAQTFHAALLIAFQDLVSSLARDTKLSAQRRHTFAILEPDHEAHAFIHNRTFPPWHVLHLGLLNQNVLPMSPERSVTYVSGRSDEFTQQFPPGF